MRKAALNTGPDFHLLDHIGPLSFLNDMPLFIEDEKNFTLSSHYYPMVKAEYLPDIERSLGFFAQNFDILYECKYWQPHLKQLFKDLYNKDMRLIFCSHGQSDKGYATPLLSPYSTQEEALIYGDLLKDMLQEMNISANLMVTGNYRLAFYQKHKGFYDALAEREIFSRLPKNQKTVLYAPTWKDADQSTSFFNSAKSLFSSFPDNWNLIVKVHPLLEMRNPAEYYHLAALIEKKPNRLLVSEFPPVYPILAKSDIYLGDYSSVGYDFLYFERPMFFSLHPNLPKGRIHSCGAILNDPADLFAELAKNQDFSRIQNKLYAYAFRSTVLT